MQASAMASKFGLVAGEGIATVAEELASFVEDMADGVALLEPSGQLAYCNRACRQLLDFADSLEKSLEQWSVQLDILAASARQSSPSFDCNTPAGRSLRVSKRATISGRALLLIQDRTEREEQLSSARAHFANVLSAKNAFVASLSRRVRTSFNSMLGFAQLSQRDTHEPLSGRHRSRIEQILEEGAQLLNLFDQVLEFVSVGSAGTFSAERLNLTDVLQEVVTAIEPLATRAGVRVETLDLPTDAPTVVAERSRVTRILVHLATTAIHGERADGALTFRVLLGESHVRLTVANASQEFSNATVKHMFEPFFVAADGQGRASGSGLELAIARALAESLNARVGCHNVPQQGAEFWLELPIGDSTARSGMRPAMIARSSSSTGR